MYWFFYSYFFITDVLLTLLRKTNTNENEQKMYRTTGVLPEIKNRSQKK